MQYCLHFAETELQNAIPSPIFGYCIAKVLYCVHFLNKKNKCVVLSTHPGLDLLRFVVQTMLIEVQNSCLDLLRLVFNASLIKCFPTLLRLDSCFEMSTAAPLLSSPLSDPAHKTSPQRCLQSYAQGTLLGALAAGPTKPEVDRTSPRDASEAMRGAHS